MGCTAVDGSGDAGSPQEEAIVNNGWNASFATHRIDIDEGAGEMMQLVLTDAADPGEGG